MPRLFLWQAADTKRSKPKGGMPVSSRSQAAFSSFKYRNFRLLWFGLVFSNVGSWVQAVAQGWLIHDITGRYLDLGLLGLFRAVPLVTLPLIGGTVADRVDKRRLLYATQASSALLALLQAALTQLGLITPTHIWLLAFGAAVASSFDQPTRQALLPSLVKREHLLNATALMSVSFTGAAVAGPAAAGLLVPLVGYAAAFYLNALSFLAVIIAVRLMSLRHQPQPAQKVPILADLGHGLKFIMHNHTIVTLAALTCAVGLLVAPYSQMLPGWRQILGIDEARLGLLTSAPGLGTLVGGFWVARYAQRMQKGRLVLYSLGLLLLSLFLFTLMRQYVLAVLVLVPIGGSLAACMSLVQTLLQQNAPDRFRARVMSVYTIGVLGLSPLGALPLGVLSDMVGVFQAIRVTVLLTALVGGLLARRIQGIM